MPPDTPSSARSTAPTINLASVVHGLEDYLAGCGADPQAILRRAAVAPEDLSDPERRVPLVRYLDLLEICAEELGDRQFGLKFGAQYQPRHAGVVGNVALASLTVRDALGTISRYLPTMVDSAVFGVDVKDGMAFAHAYYLDPLLMSYQQKGDWTIAFVCRLVREGLGEPEWGPAEALFPHLPEESSSERRCRERILRADIRGGSPWAGIRFDAAVLDRPMVTADAMIERLMRHYGELRLAELPKRHGEVDEMRRGIAELLVQGHSSIERLARRIGLSVRTLQRRLNDRGLNYSDLLNDVRKTLALNLLQNRTLCIAEIAYCLGYSEVSAFNHAFRRWQGQSPGDYRQSQQGSNAMS